MTAPVLELDALRKRYGETEALRGVSFEVYPGEIFGLLGPNGAGKSSLIRILMDIIRADSGEVRVFGEPRRREHLDRIGYLPEERGLYTKLKVVEVMTYFGALKGLPRREARARSFAWLDRVGLGHVGSWAVERLSKGMSQKVQLAAVLLSEPDLCVLDEPTTGLDPVNVRLVTELLEERRRQGKTTILSTHHMDHAQSLCERVAMVHRGRLELYGAVGDLRLEHSTSEVRVRIRGALPALSIVEEATRESEDTWRLRLAQETEPAEVLAELVGAGVLVDRFEPLLASIEDLFLRVVKERST